MNYRDSFISLFQQITGVISSFGIADFLDICLVAFVVYSVVKFVRGIIWKITDASENIKNQIELEKPIDEMVARSANEILDSFSDVLPQNKKSRKSSVQNGKKK